MTVKPPTETIVEESSDCGADDMESTYVSETDLDITELETVPYTDHLQHPAPAPEGQRSGAVQDHGRLMNTDVETEKVKEPADGAEEEDDALRLVREIFFT